MTVKELIALLNTVENKEMVVTLTVDEINGLPVYESVTSVEVNTKENSVELF